MPRLITVLFYNREPKTLRSVSSCSFSMTKTLSAHEIDSSSMTVLAVASVPADLTLKTSDPVQYALPSDFASRSGYRRNKVLFPTLVHDSRLTTLKACEGDSMIFAVMLTTPNRGSRPFALIGVIGG
jgi:hypothetical protein